MYPGDEIARQAATNRRRYLTCTRERTVGNVYNYDFWQCACGYHPGGSDGPPMEVCLNCKSPQYTDDPSKATMAIDVIPTSIGMSFKIVAYYPNRQDISEK